MSRAATQTQRETLQALCGGGALPPVPPVPAVQVAASAEPEPIPVGEATETTWAEWLRVTDAPVTVRAADWGTGYAIPRPGDVGGAA